MNIYLWQIIEVFCKKWYKKSVDWLDDVYYQSKLYNVVYFIKNLPMIIKANISLLVYFNKNECYFDWDYDYIYSLLAWKLKSVRDNMKGVKVANTGDYEARNFISDEIQCALDCLEMCSNPELTASEADTNSNEYYIKLYEIEEDCWNDFHDILKHRARSWWD